MSGEDWLRHGAELYRTAAVRSRTQAGRDRLLDCAADLSGIANWIAANRQSDAPATGAVTRDDLVQLREVYASENGDRWQLGRDLASGRVFVRHEANLPSGGHVTDVELAAFLSRPRHTPECQALIHVIGDLVTHGNQGSATARGGSLQRPITEHMRHFLLAMAAMIALAVVLHAVFGIGESLRPPPSGPWLPQLVHMPR